MLGVEWLTIETDQGTLFALTAEQFKTLSSNLAEILRWLEEAMWRLGYYHGE